jgi:hypothetical protein
VGNAKTLKHPTIFSIDPAVSRGNIWVVEFAYLTRLAKALKTHP